MARSSRSNVRSPVASPDSPITLKLCRSSEAIPSVPNLKTCSACREPKPFDQFAKSRAQRDGLDNACRACVRFRKAHAYRKKKAIEKSKRRTIASNRVVDVASLKLVLSIHAAGDCDQRYQNLISLLHEEGAA